MTSLVALLVYHQEGNNKTIEFMEYTCTTKRDSVASIDAVGTKKWSENTRTNLVAQTLSVLGGIEVLVVNKTDSHYPCPLGLSLAPS